MRDVPVFSTIRTPLAVTETLAPRETRRKLNRIQLDSYKSSKVGTKRTGNGVFIRHIRKNQQHKMSFLPLSACVCVCECVCVSVCA